MSSKVFVIQFSNHKDIVFVYKCFYYKFRFSLSSIFRDSTFYFSISLEFKKKYFSILFLIKMVLSQMFKYFFLKIRFNGLGYYLYKDKKNTIGAQFNYSHKINFYINTIFIKNFNKRSWIFKSLNWSNLSLNVKLLTSIRPTNIFTKRGIRLTKQIIYLKKHV